MNFAEQMPILALALPLLGAVVIAMVGRWPNLRETITMVVSVSLFILVASQAGQSFTQTSTLELVRMAPGLSLTLKIEPLGFIYALIATSLWIVNSLYSIGYMRANQEKHQTRFYLCFALAIAGAIGIAFAGNLLTLFVFYEALSLSTYLLVAHKGTPVAIRSARTYLGILVGSSMALFLPAIIAIWVLVGTLDFQPGGIFTQALQTNAISPTWVGILFFLCIYGIAKAALMPLHRWLPAAMVAPTPVSALLHAVAVVKAGVFSLVKVTLYLFGPQTLISTASGEWLIYVAGVSIVIASSIALFQDNLKRRLAYSTISQLSYITLGVALLSPFSIMAAAFHMIAHAFGKITLFFAAGSIYTATHKTKVSELDGIGHRMPWTMTAFAIGSLSMIGIPPTAGFISKWYLLRGAWETQYIFVLVVIVLSTFLNAAYFLPIVYRAFFRSPPPNQQNSRSGESPWPIVVALSLTALATILLFFMPEFPLSLAHQLIQGLP